MGWLSAHLAVGIDQIRTVGLRQPGAVKLSCKRGRVGIDQIRTVGLRPLDQIAIGREFHHRVSELTRSGRWDCDYNYGGEIYNVLDVGIDQIRTVGLRLAKGLKKSPLPSNNVGIDQIRTVGLRREEVEGRWVHVSMPELTVGIDQIRTVGLRLGSAPCTRFRSFRRN